VVGRGPGPEIMAWFKLSTVTGRRATGCHGAFQRSHAGSVLTAPTLMIFIYIRLPLSKGAPPGPGGRRSSLGLRRRPGKVQVRVLRPGTQAGTVLVTVRRRARHLAGRH
jgi:hypothetical protein